MRPVNERVILRILGFPGSGVKNPPAMQEMQVPSLGWEEPLKDGIETHSSILAWSILWTEDSGSLQPIESQSQHN